MDEGRNEVDSLEASMSKRSRRTSTMEKLCFVMMLETVQYVSDQGHGRVTVIHTFPRNRLVHRSSSRLPATPGP
jgi:hypothetical protein